jgi:hypothetical protein
MPSDPTIIRLRRERDEARAEVERLRYIIANEMNCTGLHAEVERLREKANDDFLVHIKALASMRGRAEEAEIEVERLKEENRKLKTRLYTAHLAILGPQDTLDGEQSSKPLNVRPAKYDYIEKEK